MSKILDSSVLRKVLLVLLSIILVFGTVETAFAGDANRLDLKYEELNEGGVLTRSGIQVDSGHSENLDGFEGTNPTKIGFDKLYGMSSRAMYYYGEVPNPRGAVNDDKLDTHPHDSSRARAFQDNMWRVWWDNPKELQDSLEWKDEKTNDLHALALTQTINEISSNFVRVISGLGFSIFAGLNSLYTSLISFEIQLANVDLTGLTGLSDSINDLLNDLFIKDSTGAFSPLFVLAVAVFIMGFAVMAAKFIRQGSVSAMAIFQEFGYLVLGMIVAGVALSGGLAALTDTMSDFATKVSAGLSSNSEHTALFEYKSDDKTADANNQQIGIVNKMYIDMMIRNQFGGYTVGDLDLKGENWGISDSEMNDLKSKVLTNGHSNVFKIKITNTSEYASDGRSDVDNLGYFWWAASCSDVNPQDPFYVDSDGKVVTNADNYGGPNGENYMIIDLLAGIDAQADGSSKAQHIMDSLRNDWHDVAGMFFLSIVSLFLMIALVVGSIFAAVGKFIFIFGAAFTPILPILIITPIKDIRAMSKRMVFTWLISALKFIVGLVYVMTIISITGALCSRGYIGMLIAIVLLAAMVVFAPKIFVALNNAVDSSAVGREQLGFVRDYNRRFNNAADRFQSSRSPLARLQNSREKREELKDKMQDLAPTSKQVGMNQVEAELGDLNNFGSGGERYTPGAGGGGVVDVAATFNGEDMEELDNIKNKAADEIDRIENLSTTEEADEFGLDNKAYMSAARSLEAAKLRKEMYDRQTAERMTKELEWRRTNIGQIVQAVPILGTIDRARERLLVERRVKIGGVEWDFDLKRNTANKAVADAQGQLDLMANHQKTQYTDSNGNTRTVTIGEFIEKKRGDAKRQAVTQAKAEAADVVAGAKKRTMKIANGTDQQNNSSNTNVPKNRQLGGKTQGGRNKLSDANGGNSGGIGKRTNQQPKTDNDAIEANVVGSSSSQATKKKDSEDKGKTGVFKANTRSKRRQKSENNEGNGKTRNLNLNNSASRKDDVVTSKVDSDTPGTPRRQRGTNQQPKTDNDVGQRLKDALKSDSEFSKLDSKEEFPSLDRKMNIDNSSGDTQSFSNLNNESSDK